MNGKAKEFYSVSFESKNVGFSESPSAAILMAASLNGFDSGYFRDNEGYMKLYISDPSGKNTVNLHSDGNAINEHSSGFKDDDEAKRHLALKFIDSGSFSGPTNGLDVNVVLVNSDNEIIKINDKSPEEWATKFGVDLSEIPEKFSISELISAEKLNLQKPLNPKIYAEGEKHHGIIPEIKYLPLHAIERKAMDFRPEVLRVSSEVAENMDFSQPIEVTAFRYSQDHDDLKPVVLLQDGHHRTAAAIQTNRAYLPVEVRAINAKGEKLNSLIALSNEIELRIQDEERLINEDRSQKLSEHSQEKAQESMTDAEIERGQAEQEAKWREEFFAEMDSEPQIVWEAETWATSDDGLSESKDCVVRYPDGSFVYSKMESERGGEPIFSSIGDSHATLKLALADAQGILSKDEVVRLLSEQDEICNPENIAYYESLESLAEKVRSSRSWSQGEVFVYSGGKDDFVVMKQIAPCSCEMLTITNQGYMDVMTAYRFEQDELVTAVREHMQGNKPIASIENSDDENSPGM